MARITWLGHAAFRIEIAGKVILIDPWLTDNPVCPVKVSEITQADMLYVTHDHGDHLGDAFEICRRTGATFVAAFELANHAQEKGVKNAVGLNVGGSTEIKGIELYITQAFHTASKGAPTGVIIEGEGKAVYHAGDTALFGDMRLFGELYSLDVAMVPIGGYYTMSAKEAVEAVKMLKPKAVIPMHYRTFPVLAQSSDEFVKRVKEKTPEVKVAVLNPGESYQF
jgi:L-ascorbate metabolism protein UlaG (beta-lactamase superfamily)